MFCLKAPRALKTWHRNKSWVSFENFRKFSIHWAQRFYHLNYRKLRNLSLKWVGVKNHCQYWVNFLKLGRSLKAWFSLTFFVIFIKFQCLLESWWQDNSKTAPALEHCLKIKVLWYSKGKPCFLVRCTVPQLYCQVRISKSKLKSLNTAFSASNGSNW